AALLAERTGIDITERVAAAQVLAGDPVAMAAERNANGLVSRSPIDEDEGEQDWLRADGR
ncbi:MAG: hypothetical protein ACXVGB_11385, partial [Mycobacteriaceae bacterium]